MNASKEKAVMSLVEDVVGLDECGFADPFAARPCNCTLLSAYMANGKMGVAALCGLILADTETLLDLGAKQGALDALAVLGLLMSAFPELDIAAIPNWSWANPSKSPCDASGEALRNSGLEAGRRSSPSGEIYLLHKFRRPAASSASPSEQAAANQTCAPTSKEYPS